MIQKLRKILIYSYVENILFRFISPKVKAFIHYNVNHYKCHSCKCQIAVAIV